MATFPERLRELREERGLKQEQLGAEIGAAGNAVSRWELGQHLPREKTRFFIASYFGVQYAYLMGYTDDRDELIVTEEEIEAKAAQDAKEDEEQLIQLYRMLSPEMQKMIQTTVDQAYLIDKRRGALKLPSGK